MPQFRQLSIREDNDHYDRVTIEQQEYHPNNQKLTISVTSTKNLVITASSGGKITTINSFDFDINGLIEFLIEAKTFISEEEMVRKLTGK